jgi:thymidine phosphorylase
MLEQAIVRGDGARVFERMIEAQGGDPGVVTDPARLVVAPVEVVVRATDSGYVSSVDAMAIGLAAVAMGAGRARADAKIDAAVGLSIDAKRGAAVKAGDPLARIHVRSAADAEAIAERVRGAFVIHPERPAASPLVRGRLGA